MESIEKILDFDFYAENFIKIIDKAGNKIPFKLNNIQQKIDEKIEELEAQKKPVRLIILKPRQPGVSTYVQAKFLHKTATNFNKTALVVAHTDVATSSVFGKAKLMFENLPAYIRPMRKASNSNELIFDKPSTDKSEKKGLNSKFKVSTAGGSGIGRGDTPAYVHLCLHEDSRVILSDGMSRPIKEINIGDNIITSSGKIAMVSKIFNQGIKKTYKVKTWLSNEYVAMTAEHKVLTLGGYKECSKLTKDDYIQVPRISLSNEITEYTYSYPITGICYDKRYDKWSAEIAFKNKRKYIGAYKTEKEATEAVKTARKEISPDYLGKESFKLDYDFGYLLGYYLAEGHIDKLKRRITFACHKDESYIDKILEYIKPIQDKHRTVIDNNRKIIEINSNYLAVLISDICGRVESKNIPDWFFKTNKKFIQGVLAGYFSGDGSKGKVKCNGKYKIHCISSVSIHERITRQIKRLIISLDYGVPSIRHEANRYRYDKKTKDVYTVHCFGQIGEKIENLIGNNQKCNKKSNINKYKNVNGNWYVKVRSMEEFEESNVIDIEVDSDDHNFETPIGIVSNSELAFYPGDIKKTFIGIMQSVPKLSGTIVIIESTANSFNEFKLIWDRAVDGDNDFVPLFFAWFDHEQYQMECTDKEKKDIMGNLSEYEAKLVELYPNSITPERIKWYRYTLNNDCAGSHDLMKQENPSNAEEAFLHTGRPVFDMEKIDYRLKELHQKYKETPPDVGYIEYDEDERKYNFISDRSGTITIFEHPKRGFPYVIGSDVAEGLSGGDWSTVSICDNTTGNQVAVIRKHILPDKFADDLLMIARYFNNALIAVEINNHGRTTRDTLVNTHRYYIQYKRETVDDISKEKKQEFGFLTTMSTRPQLINLARKIVRDDINLINDLQTLREMSTFVYSSSGKEEAEIDCHDDCVIAFAVMHKARGQFRTDASLGKAKVGKEEHWSVVQDSYKNTRVRKMVEERTRNIKLF